MKIQQLRGNSYNEVCRARRERNSESTRINIKGSQDVVVKNMVPGAHLCGLELWFHRL